MGAVPEGASRRWRIGVDTGGTFTDVCLFEEESGAVRVAKVSSTPDDPADAIIQGVAQIIIDAGGAVGQPPGAAVRYFAHGSTVTTNALLQGRGVPTGLITTAGFRDLLELGRQRRADLYDLQVDKPEPLVRRDRRLEVAERVRADGWIERPLDEREARAAARRLRDLGVRAIAICLLYSYLAPQHEQVIQQVVREEFPEAYVSASHEVLPEFREYERLSTVVVNAYLGPVMAGYLRRLRPRLQQLDITVPPHITQSNGSILSLETAAQHPVRTILSGPSAGVVGAGYVAHRAGFDDVITFDMGGTSTDVALIERGRPRMAQQMEVRGYPIKAPMLDINTVGAGGGSIAWIDQGGHLKVGPQSAGANPGPACYGLGNTEPTVTDANVVLGLLNPTALLGGGMPIQAAAAERSVARLGERLGLDVPATAQGIISVVTATMARAIRVISIQRGYDPRDYTLVAFGGGGPLHAARLARDLEIPTMLVPAAPGLLCALGLLVTDLRTDYSLTRLLPATAAALAALAAAFAELEQQAAAWFEREGIPPERRLVRRSVDMRYTGQNYELAVPAPTGPLTPEHLAALRDAFAQQHLQTYGFAADEAIQIVTFRLEALALVPKAELPADDDCGCDASAACAGTRRVYLPEAGGTVACPVYQRDRLRCGNQVMGPAIIEQMDSTTLLLPGQGARVDCWRNLVIGMDL